MSERTLSRPDTGGLIGFMIAGAIIAILTVGRAVVRISEVLGGADVRVPAEFAGTPAEAPIGPGGAPVTVELDTAVLIAPELPAASVAALVLEQVTVALTIVVVVGALLWLTANIIRGRIFSRTNTALVITAGFAGLIGYCLAPFFANMGANGAFARISDRTFDNVVMSVDLFPLLFLAFLVGLAGTVFGIGDRLRRETDGLV
ncbi:MULTISPECIES: hypothetical protein [unclassified Microbacterium]|uniref:hypothetical protein n=1 Tax=unclassified Microbacterium TaxID=2609290 RepID=UPI00374619E9